MEQNRLEREVEQLREECKELKKRTDQYKSSNQVHNLKCFPQNTLRYVQTTVAAIQHDLTPVHNMMLALRVHVVSVANIMGESIFSLFKFYS